MSFFSAEASKFLSRPVELYHFKYADVNYFFTSSDQIIEYNSQKWYPMTLNRKNIMSSLDIVRSDLTVTLSQDNPLMSYFLYNEIQTKMNLYVYRLQIEEHEAILMFSGELSIFEIKNELELEAKFSQISQDLINNSQKYTYSYACNRTQYSRDCSLSLNENSDFDITILEINNKILTVENTEKPSGYYANGIMWITIEQKRYTADILSDVILDNNKREIKVNNLLELKENDKVNLAYGCGYSSGGCKDVNNFDNFLGFEYIPTEDYFRDGINDKQSEQEDEDNDDFFIN